MRGLLKSETKIRANLKMDCSSPRRPWDKGPTLSLKCTMCTAGFCREASVFSTHKTLLDGYKSEQVLGPRSS